MRKNTPKRAKVNRQADKLRRDFIIQNPRCWKCGVFGTQCHEMVGGGSRALAIQEPKTYMALCGVNGSDCHTEVAQWPLEKQLGMKLINDPDRFDPVAVCLVAGFSVEFVSLSDVVQYLEMKDE